MNYISNNPSALIEFKNLTLSPFAENEYNQFSGFTPKNKDEYFIIGDQRFVDLRNERRLAKNQEINAQLSNIKELTEDKFQAVDDQLAASKESQEQMSKKFKDQKELLIIGGSIMLIILIFLFLGKK